MRAGLLLERTGDQEVRPATAGSRSPEGRTRRTMTRAGPSVAGGAEEAGPSVAGGAEEAGPSVAGGAEEAGHLQSEAAGGEVAAVEWGVDRVVKATGARMVRAAFLYHRSCAARVRFGAAACTRPSRRAS
jgi:hypothetical protein